MVPAVVECDRGGGDSRLAESDGADAHDAIRPQDHAAEGGHAIGQSDGAQERRKIPDLIGGNTEGSGGITGGNHLEDRFAVPEPDGTPRGPPLKVGRGFEAVSLSWNRVVLELDGRGNLEGLAEQRGDGGKAEQPEEA